MSKNKKKFANLLKGATLRIQSESVIQAGLPKTKKDIYEQIGDGVGVSPDTIEWWFGSTRKTFPEDIDLENLVRTILSQADMGSEWVEGLLVSAAYIGTDSFIRELYPTEVEGKPELTTLPRIPHFVGRDEERNYYFSRLQAESIVAITGMTGVGKSALAVQLAKQWGDPDQIFWHRCYEYEGIELIERLASFLAVHGQRDVWDLIQNSEQNKLSLPDNKKLFYKLARDIRKGPYLLCFDDFHTLEDDPDIVYFLRQLLDGLSSYRYGLIVVGQREIGALRQYEFKQLEGLPMNDARELLVDFNLPEHLEEELYRQTQGNAELLTLLRGWLSPENQVKSLLQNLTQAGRIHDFVLERVHRNLNTLQVQVLRGISVFRGYAGSRSAIEFVLDGQNIFEELLYLKECYLLTENVENGVRVYSVHEIVRVFYYESLSDNERKEMHRRAATYYLDSEHNVVQAAFQLEYANAYDDLLHLIAKNIWTLINQGHGAKMPKLFERIAFSSKLDLSDSHTSFLWSKVKGTVQRFEGNHQESIATFERALQKEPNSESEAELLKQLGATYERIGEFEQALGYYLQSLEISKNSDNIVQFTGTNFGVGWVYLQLGKVAQAKIHLDKCLELAEQQNDRRHIALSTFGLGIINYQSDRLQDAHDLFVKSRDIFQQQGDLAREAQLIGNLSRIYYQMGDTDKAIESTQYFVNISEQTGSIYNQLSGYNNLGYFYSLLEDHVNASHYYTELINLAEETEHMRMLSLGYSGLADVALLALEPEKALELGQQAQDIAQAHNYTAEIGVSYRVLGNVWLALKGFSEAQACFTKSIPLLEETGEVEELRQAQQGYQLASS